MIIINLLTLMLLIFIISSCKLASIYDEKMEGDFVEKKKIQSNNKN